MNDAAVEPDWLMPEIVTTLRSVLARDLGETPLYGVWAHDVTNVVDGGDFLGLTIHSLDLIARDAIGDDWRGRGPAFMLNRDAILALPAGPTIGDKRLAFICTARAVAVHEAAHLIVGGLHRGPAPAPEVLAAVKHEVVCAATSAPRPPSSTLASDLRQHGPQWMRTVIHLADRACRASLWLMATEAAMGNEMRGCSPSRKYDDALGDEVERMAGATFAEILEAPAPPAFTELWLADLERLTTAAVAA